MAIELCLKTGLPERALNWDKNWWAIVSKCGGQANESISGVLLQALTVHHVSTMFSMNPIRTSMMGLATQKICGLLWSLTKT